MRYLIGQHRGPILLLLCLLIGSAGEPAPDLPKERTVLARWLQAALFAAPADAPATPRLEVRRQDHGVFQLGQSVMKTPLQIGEQRFTHGLGTHAVSDIAVALPAPATRFTAQVGIDNNYDTQGKRGSVIFIVEAAGKELFRSGICRGGDAPVSVDIALPGVRALTLRVLDNGDGPGWDQSDWAEAKVMLNNDTTLYLDTLPLDTPAVAGLLERIPFSFTYDGKSSRELLPAWQRTVTEEPAAHGTARRSITFTDPATGLQLRCEATIFTELPAVEWVLYFTNTGQADSPLLERIQALDLGINLPDDTAVLHHAHGSTCTATDFLPIEQAITPNADLILAPNGGRSSDGRLPFFNLAWADGGLVGAIGWSGQWALQLHRDTKRLVTLQAGQQTTHLRLHPGERIRTPRILLVAWQGDDRLRGHNYLRQTLLTHYLPRRNGEVILPPVAQNTWFAYQEGNNVTEANQFAAMRPMVATGVEAYWLDAGWFEGGWPNGAGSWVPKATAFPRGLKPLGDEAHRQDMQFVLWFEPERVTSTSRIAKEHPEWVMHSPNDNDWGRLFNLGNPEARAWLTDHLSQCITDWGVDIYRNDFNIDPLRFWQAADAPDRQGMAEIRYIEGLYALWDELRRRHPHLAIDNCASGGRRIDLETLSRSYPLWRSDTQCGGKAMPIWDQAQTAGLSLYVPLHAAGLWDFAPYPARSVATTGFSICPSTEGADFSLAQARKVVDETKALRPYYLGDFYPLFAITLDARLWAGWQYHRPDLNQGFAVVFRRDQSPYTTADVHLHGLDPQATYRITCVDTGEQHTRTGAQLQQWSVTIPTAPGTVLYRYEQVLR